MTLGLIISTTINKWMNKTKFKKIITFFQLAYVLGIGFTLVQESWDIWSSDSVFFYVSILVHTWGTQAPFSVSWAAAHVYAGLEGTWGLWSSFGGMTDGCFVAEPLVYLSICFLTEYTSPTCTHPPALGFQDCAAWALYWELGGHGWYCVSTGTFVGWWVRSWEGGQIESLCACIHVHGIFLYAHLCIDMCVMWIA